MAAAILQGVIETTIDTDIWVDLPERQYVRLMNICVSQGGTAMAPTLYVLADGRVINFLFRVDGIKSFDSEHKNAVVARLENQPVRVLPLERILKSKKAILRDKDKLHILLIERFLKCQKKSRIKKRE
jgi:hypothetical protein